MKDDRIYGRNAVRAVLARRIDDVRRLFVLETESGTWSDALRELAKRRVKYELVDDESLGRLAESQHHEGVVVFVAPRPKPALDTLLARRGPLSLLVLEHVDNPHNLGAIVRTCAHFGVDGVLLVGERASLGSAGTRVAEGGAEHVGLWAGASLEALLLKLHEAGVKTLATSSHAPGASGLFDVAISNRHAWIFGAEREGLTERAWRGANERVVIPGSGAVESLNVAAAVAVCLAESVRRGASKTNAPGAKAPSAPSSPPKSTRSVSRSRPSR